MLNDQDVFNNGGEEALLSWRYWVEDVVEGKIYSGLTRRERLVQIRNYAVAMAVMVDGWIREVQSA